MTFKKANEIWKQCCIKIKLKDPIKNWTTKTAIERGMVYHTRITTLGQKTYTTLGVNTTIKGVSELTKGNDKSPKFVYVYYVARLNPKVRGRSFPMTWEHWIADLVDGEENRQMLYGSPPAPLILVSALRTEPTLAHEIGHQLALDHRASQGNLMSIGRLQGTKLTRSQCEWAISEGWTTTRVLVKEGRR